MQRARRRLCERNSVSVSLSLYICVCEREKEREREWKRDERDLDRIYRSILRDEICFLSLLRRHESIILMLDGAPRDLGTAGYCKSANAIPRYPHRAALRVRVRARAREMQL